MANTLRCDIVTPNAMLYVGDAVLLTAPAAGGEIGFMYQCSPRMSTLRRGTVRIKSETDEVLTFAVDGGYLEVDGYKVVVLASHAIDLSMVDKELASARIEKNEKRLETLEDDDPAKAFAEEEISWQKYLISLL